MARTTHIIVSDLHMGSPHFRREAFQAFLEQLPEDAVLVLNGDTLDNPARPLPPDHAQVLDRILGRASEVRGNASWSSEDSPVVWVQGNHDWGYRPEAADGDIHWCQTYRIGDRLFVAHGHDFDSLMPHHCYFIKIFGWFHKLRILLGAPPVHVAEYAKSWSRLYTVLRRHVMRNALRFAQEEGCQAVTCGHVHYPEELEVEGTRYLNTGTWTEDDFRYIQVTDQAIFLKHYRES